MFFGQILLPGKIATLTQAANDVIRISNVCFEGTNQEQASLYIIKGETKVLLAKVDNRRSQIQLDLYFLKEEGIKFELQGTGKVHLVGYCEPSDLVQNEPKQTAPL